MSGRRRRNDGEALPRPPGPLHPMLSGAQQEAENARHGYVGVEHLLVVLADDPTGATSRLLAEHGVTRVRARDAVDRVVSSGRGDGPAWDAGTLLATIGIDLAEIRRQVEAQFGADAIARLYTSPTGWNLPRRGPLCGPPLSPQLKRALNSALGGCWNTPPPQPGEHLLLGALDTDSTGLSWVLDELSVSIPLLRAAITAELRIAS